MGIPLCEFCNTDPYSVEIELFNISVKETVLMKTCSKCAVKSSSTGIQYDSDGIAYSDLGCIGGAPEEVN